MEVVQASGPPVARRPASAIISAHQFMKTRTLLILGVLAVSASAATGEVRLKIEGGRHVIYNDGPAKLRASEDWLAARMQKAG